MDIPKLIAAQRAYFETGATRDIAVRRRALQALQASVRRHEEVLCSALRADLGKSVVESYMTEIGIVAGEIRFALRNLKRWMRPRRVPTPLFAWPARSRVRYEPLGVVLVVAPWNYPLQLTLLPLVGALAAGNCVVLNLRRALRPRRPFCRRSSASAFRRSWSLWCRTHRRLWKSC